MLEKVVDVRDINESEIFESVCNYLNELNDEKYDVIDIDNVTIERLREWDTDKLVSEEVTVILKYDNDEFDVFNSPVSNEIKFKIPDDREYNLGYVSEKVVREIDEKLSLMERY